MQLLYVHVLASHVPPTRRSWGVHGGFAFAACVGGLLLLLVGEYVAGAATLLLALGVNLYLRLADAYNRTTGTPRGQQDPAASVAANFTSLATSLVTLNGVVLALVFSFLGEGEASLVVKLGAAALALGILLGLTLMLAVSFGVSTRERVDIAFNLLLSTVYGCAYGILCIAAAVVLER